MGTLTARVAAWKARGHNENFRDYNIHCFFNAGNGDGPLHVICHGYPTCSYDWIKVIEIVPSKSILTFDFLGFGLSDKPHSHNYSLTWQADLVEELILRHNKQTNMINRDVVLIGHDMGTSVVAEVIARDIDSSLRPNINLIGAFLFNGSMFMERAHLILGQKLLRSPLGHLFARLTFSLPFKWQLGSVFSALINSPPLSSHPDSTPKFLGTPRFG